MRELEACSDLFFPKMLSFTLHQSLFPVHSLIHDRLERLKSVFQDADEREVRIEYHRDEQFEPEKAKKLFSEITQSLGDGAVQLLPNKEIKKMMMTAETGVLTSARWGLTSKSRFEKLTTKIESYINKLNELLTESQHWSSLHDWRRVNIVIAGNVRDQDSLDLIQNALQQDALDGPTRSVVERKAITILAENTPHSGIPALRPLDMALFDIPKDSKTRTRFITCLKDNANEGYFLFEKKEYDRDISAQDKQLLKARIDRLVLLLSSRKSNEFRTLEAFGCCSDPASFCWWLVFRYPLIHNAAMPFDIENAQPVSLLSLFTSRYKPPLEHRFQLTWKLG
jgi:hypothetical protein